MPWTIGVENRALGTLKFEGTYDTMEAAAVSLLTKSVRWRKFVIGTVWKGTPRNPIEDTNIVVQGDT